MTNIVMYTKIGCPFCARAKALLEQKGAAFKEIVAADDPKLRAEMVQKANGRNTFPQIFIGDYHVGGSDELVELDREGKLDQLLKEKG